MTSAVSRAAGLLLTGGASRRFGSDKAVAMIDGTTLAARSARVLGGVCAPAFEVGAGVAPLPAIREEPAGGGPLVAMVAGWAELQRHGWGGATIVMAVDLPRVSTAFVKWLVDHPSSDSVVPFVDDRAQPLCARYSAEAMATARRLAAEGARAMRDLLAEIAVTRVEPVDWRAVADAEVMMDVDTPEDLAELRRSGE